MRPIDADAIVFDYNGLAYIGPYNYMDIAKYFADQIARQPTLTPPNEAEYREYTCPYCYHTWLEDRDASDYPNYCPVCRAVLRDGSAPPNEPLTLEQLREMGGQPYWHVGLRKESPPPHWNILDPFYAKHIEDYKYGENWLAYLCPPEGEVDA
nr:MAG TPA: DNA-directed RNA polymerase [Caudoviricetes sp.]